MEEEIENLNPKLIWIIFFLFVIGIILGTTYLIVNEIYNARRECNNLDGEYDFKFLQGHLCNGKRFVKYSSCQVITGKLECNLIWVFEDSINKINVSEFIK